MKVKSITKCNDTPLEITKDVPWDKMTKCIVIYDVQDDGATFVRISSMCMKDRVWMANCLENLNIVDSINNVEDNSNGKTSK